MSGWRKCINPTSHNSVSVKSSVCRFRGRARSFKTFSFKVAGFRARLLCKRIGFRLFLSSKVPILRFSFQLGGLWRSLRVFFFFFFCSSEAVCWLSSISCSFFSLLFKMSIRTFFLQQKASVSPAAADRDTNTGRTTQCYHYYNCYLIIMIIIVRFHKIKTDFQQKKNNELEKLSVKFHHKSQISSFLIFKSKQEELINIIYKTEPSEQQTAINKNIKMGF